MIDFNDSDLAKNLTDAFLKPNESNNYKMLEIERAQIESYIDDLHNFLNGTHASNLNVNVKTKATPMGKAFSEKMNEVAFANVLIITAMVSLITLVAVLTYVILK